MRVIRNKRFNRWARKHLSPPSKFSYGDDRVETEFNAVVGGGGVFVIQRSKKYGWDVHHGLSPDPGKFLKYVLCYLLTCLIYWYMEDGHLYDRLVGTDWDEFHSEERILHLVEADSRDA